ncbi:hypothetical protein QF035_001097 [Streptomyces umbrinus]|uniref:Uncharacterized protein n=1 Tax=Streptomyces umbrinus TaxID=67370 RepID=A0ABU0SIY2_9ACTN|nr:hypothetical protein [Streptomyces umbrinus]
MPSSRTPEPLLRGARPLRRGARRRLPGRRAKGAERLDTAVLENRISGAGVDVDLALYGFTARRVDAAHGDPLGEDACSGGQDDEPAGGTGERALVLVALARQLRGKVLFVELGEDCVDGTLDGEFLADLGRRAGAQCGEVLSRGAGDDPLPVLLLHADDVLTAQDGHASVLLLEPNSLPAVGGDSPGGYEIALRIRDAEPALLVVQVGAGRARRAARRRRLLPDVPHERRCPRLLARYHLPRARRLRCPRCRRVGRNRRDDERGDTEQRRRT